MKALKSARIVAASLGVLAFGAMAASPAMAFDKVHWTWTKHVNEWVNIDACIKLNVVITGMVEVEKLQIFLGDVKATSTVSHIYNTPFYPVVEQKKREDHYPSVYGDNKGGYDDKGKDAQTYAVDDTHYYYRDAKSSRYDYEHELKLHDRGGEPDFDKINVKPLDAKTQLPIVLSQAQAIGNNQSITSDVPVFLHDGQFLADVKDYRRKEEWSPDNMLASVSGASPTTFDGGRASFGNTNTILAVLFGIGAIEGALKHSDITAKSDVYDVHNVSVDSSATAIGNNISVNLASNEKNNHVLIADITQFALANVTAESSVHDVTATGYENMRQLTTSTLQDIDGKTNVAVDVPTPWISSVATAVGNNATINVGPVLKNGAK